MAKAKKTSPLRERSSGGLFSSLSPLTQDLLCIGFLYVLTLILFRSIVFNNMAFSTANDTANAVTYAKVGDEIMEKEGVDAIWMPNFFSGMPTFGNVHYIPHDVSYVQKAAVAVLKLFYLNSTWGWFPVYYLFCGLFTFLLLRVWKLSRVAALFGAIVFMMSPYGIGLAAEGHGSKLMALSYLPLVFLLTNVVFERRDILSFGLLSAAIGTLLLTNHMQIVYYIFMVLGFYLLYHIVRDFKENKRLIPTKTLLLAGAIALGLCISSYVYLSVYEYAQYSIRGGGTTGAKGGLTWEYATNWSFHPQEILTFFIPSFFGFSSQYIYNWQGQQIPLPLYWGTMPFNTATVYFGIMPIVLAIVAFIYKRNTKVLFFALMTLLVLMISFGKHFGLFYELLFNTLPFFDKFRAPAMILHLVAFTFAVMGAFGLHFLLEEITKDFNAAKFKKGLYIAFGVIGSILVLGVLMKSSLFELFGFTFVREGETYGAQTAQILQEFKRIRFELLWKDYIKFALLTGAAGGVIILYLTKKISSAVFSTLIIGIAVVDLFIIDAKFIDPKPHRDIEQNLLPTPTISFLKQQEGLFRVFPLGDEYNNGLYGYHGLHSVGGYSPAKLKIYQTLVDSCFYQGSDPGFPLNKNVVNMLNARYLVANGQLPPPYRFVNADEANRLYTFENPGTLARAFFVWDTRLAANDTEVFRTLNNAGFDPGKTAILQSPLNASLGSPDTNATVSVTRYESRKITLKTITATQALLVLSEIYYPAGWSAYIDGVEAAIHRTNYVLRSVVVPPGSHEVEFRFDPLYYELGWTLSNSAWGVVLVCVILGMWRTPSIRKRIGQRTSGKAGETTG